jgi:hypothetical protein
MQPVALSTPARGLDSPSVWPDRTPLLSLLKAGYELLQPPSPLPTSTAALAQRLERSDAIVDVPESSEGTGHGTYCVCAHDDGPSGSSRVQDEKCRVVNRCAILLWSIQDVLRLEHLSADERKGLEPNDCEFQGLYLHLCSLLSEDDHSNQSTYWFLHHPCMVCFRYSAHVFTHITFIPTPSNTPAYWVLELTRQSYSVPPIYAFFGLWQIS